jgi:hypothetical protein
MKQLVAICTDVDRRAVATTLPNVVGDNMYNMFAESVRLYLADKRQCDQQSAINATKAAISSLAESDLASIADVWQNEKRKNQMPTDKTVNLFVSSYDYPIGTASSAPSDCMKDLGPDIIKAAFVNADIGLEELHCLKRKDFDGVVETALVEKHGSDMIEISHWYHGRQYTDKTLQFLQKNISAMSDKSIREIVLGDLKLRPKSVLNELKVREQLLDAIKECLSGDRWELGFAMELSNIAIGSTALVSKYGKNLLDIWHTRRNDGRVKKLMANKQDQSNMRFLWQLQHNPQQIGQQRGKVCMERFGME